MAGVSATFSLATALWWRRGPVDRTEPFPFPSASRIRRKRRPVAAGTTSECRRRTSGERHAPNALLDCTGGIADRHRGSAACDCRNRCNVRRCRGHSSRGQSSSFLRPTPRHSRCGRARRPKRPRPASASKQRWHATSISNSTRRRSARSRRGCRSSRVLRSMSIAKA